MMAKTRQKAHFERPTNFKMSDFSPKNPHAKRAHQPTPLDPIIAILQQNTTREFASHFQRNTSKLGKKKKISFNLWQDFFSSRNFLIVIKFPSIWGLMHIYPRFSASLSAGLRYCPIYAHKNMLSRSTVQASDKSRKMSWKRQISIALRLLNRPLVSFEISLIKQVLIIFSDTFSSWVNE